MLFERFTERARQVVVLAEIEARTLKHGYVGTEHLLLGLAGDEASLASRVLASLDITTERARAQVVRIVGSGERPIDGQIPLTPRAKKVLEVALREALALGHNYIGTEHILLGLVREGEGVAARILLDFDADSEKVRNEVIRMLQGRGPSTRQRRGLDPVVARPVAHRRTGKVSIPTIWNALARRVLDVDETDGTRKLCAETLARLVLAASEGHDG